MENLTDEQVNELFCKEVGIKKACCYLYNKDTDEIRFYSNLSGLYKIPAGWKNIEKEKIDPCYPDFINNAYNFSSLLNIQWYLFNEIGAETYIRCNNNCFEKTYLLTRIQAIKLCKSFGGGQMFEEYLKKLRETPFDYLGEKE